MQYTITQAALGQRPRVVLPDTEILTALTEEGMRNLIDRHYELLVQTDIKGLFPPTPQGLKMAKKHAADFFIQICGGPRYFDQSRGAPRMIARHAPFKITPHARIVWLEKYQEALEETQLNDQLKTSFWNYLDIFSIWMINTPDETFS